METPSLKQKLKDTMERHPDTPTAKQRMRELAKLPRKERNEIRRKRLEWKQEQKRKARK